MLYLASLQRDKPDEYKIEIDVIFEMLISSLLKSTPGFLHTRRKNIEQIIHTNFHILLDLLLFGFIINDDVGMAKLVFYHTKDYRVQHSTEKTV
jgi:hypothetical protein